MASKRAMGDVSKRIVHIIGSKTLGGAERFFFRLVRALNEAGLKTIAFVRKGSEVEGNCPRGMDVKGLPMRTVWDPFSMLAIRRALKGLSPIVVQTYMGRATRLTRLPIGRPPVHVARLGGYYKLAGYRHAHAWIGNTKGVCDYLIKEGFPRERVFHVPNFVQVQEDVSGAKILLERKRLGLREDDWIIVTAGRFIEVKGHMYLFEAFKRLPRAIKGKRPLLIVLGDGPLYPEYRNFVKNNGLMERIRFPGWIKEPERFYLAADLVAFPSLEMEALGNVILEAWACRRTVLTTSFRGALELTTHGKDVYQVPCRDSAALAKALRHLLVHQDLRRHLAETGYERARMEFSREVVVKRYMGLYSHLEEGILKAGA